MGFGRGRGFGRERLLRGHLNMIILEIIKERPRHGYDVIKAIEEKFHGFYSPSAGSVYFSCANRLRSAPCLARAAAPPAGM